MFDGFKQIINAILSQPLEGSIPQTLPSLNQESSQEEAIRQMFEHVKIKLTIIQNTLEEMYFKIDATRIDQPTLKPSPLIVENSSEDVTISSSTKLGAESSSNSTLTTSIKPHLVDRTLKSECQRCSVKLSAILFEIRTLRGCERQLAKSDNGAEARNLLSQGQIFKEKLDKIARKHEADSHNDNLITEVADALEEFHKDFANIVYSIIG